MQAGAPLAERESAAAAPAGRPDPTSPERGDRLVAGGYTLGEVLSRNSAVIVCEAHRDGRRYALKLARAEGGTVGRDRLAEEYRLASMLGHPNIATPLAWISDCATPGMVFEYFAGGDLVSLAGASLSHWARPLLELARALQYLHGRGLVHRDVKARNVMFESTGRAVLIDLGSCRPVGSAWKAGGTTAGHRRPGRPLTIQSGDDVYAYAVLVGEMLGGQSDAHAARPTRERLQTLVRECIVSAGGDADGKLAAFEAVLESVSEETFLT